VGGKEKSKSTHKKKGEWGAEGTIATGGCQCGLAISLQWGWGLGLGGVAQAHGARDCATACSGLQDYYGCTPRRQEEGPCTGPRPSPPAIGQIHCWLVLV
jgi:hypothetical protein